MCSASATGFLLRSEQSLPPRSRLTLKGGVILNSLKGGSADTHLPAKSLDAGLNHSGMTGETRPAGNPSFFNRQTLAPHSRLTPHRLAYGLAPSSYRQSLLPQSANARSSLAFDLAITVIGFSSGWARIPRANESFLIDERRGENETGDSARAV